MLIENRPNPESILNMLWPCLKYKNIYKIRNIALTINLLLLNKASRVGTDLLNLRCLNAGLEPVTVATKNNRRN